jgi:hypothetical protein
MSNPHIRAQYPYQNDTERYPDSNTATHAASRPENGPRAGLERQAAEDDRLYRAARSDLRVDDEPPASYPPDEREFIPRHGRDSGHAAAALSASYPARNGTRPSYAESAGTHARDDAHARSDPWRQEAAGSDATGSHTLANVPPRIWAAGRRQQDLEMWQATVDRHREDRASPLTTVPIRDRRGPKGYVRSDERIREEICERLVRDPRLDVGEVMVDVKDGRVLLSGAVPDRRMKHVVEDIADDCWGVQDIDNRLRVIRPEQQESPSAPSVWRNRLGALTNET